MENYILTKIDDFLRFPPPELPESSELSMKICQHIMIILQDLLEKHINDFKDLAFYFLSMIKPILEEASKKIIKTCNENIFALNQIKYLVFSSEISEITKIIIEYNRINEFFTMLNSKENKANEIWSLKWYKIAKLIGENILDQEVELKIQPLQYVNLNNKMDKSDQSTMNMKSSIKDSTNHHSTNNLISQREKLSGILDKMKAIGEQHLRSAKMEFKGILSNISLKRILNSAGTRVELSKSLTQVFLRIYENFLEEHYESTNKNELLLFERSSPLKQEKKFYDDLNEILLSPDNALFFLQNNKIRSLLQKNLEKIKFEIDTLYQNLPISLCFKEVPNIKMLNFSDRWLESNSIDNMKISWVYHEPMQDKFPYFVILFKTDLYSYTIAYVDNPINDRFEVWKMKTHYIDLQIQNFLRPIFDLMAKVGLLKYFIWGLKEYVLTHISENCIKMTIAKVIDILYILIERREIALNYFKINYPMNTLSLDQIANSHVNYEWPIYEENYEIQALSEKNIHDFNIFKNLIKGSYSQRTNRAIIHFPKKYGFKIIEDYILTSQILRKLVTVKEELPINLIPLKVIKENLRSVRKSSLYQTMIIPWERYRVKRINDLSENLLTTQNIHKLERIDTIKNSVYKEMNLSILGGSVNGGDGGVGGSNNNNHRLNKNLDTLSISEDIMTTSQKVEITKESAPEETTRATETYNKATPLKRGPSKFFMKTKERNNSMVTMGNKDDDNEMLTQTLEQINIYFNEIKQSFKAKFDKKNKTNAKNFDILIIFDINIFNIIAELLVFQANKFRKAYLFYFGDEEMIQLIKEEFINHSIRYFNLSNNDEIEYNNIEIINQKVKIKINSMNHYLCFHNNLIFHNLIITKFLEDSDLIINFQDLHNLYLQNIAYFIDQIIDRIPKQINQQVNQLFSKNILQFYEYKTSSNMIQIIDQITQNITDIIDKSSQKFVLIEFFEMNSMKITIFIQKSQATKDINTIVYDVSYFDQITDIGVHSQKLPTYIIDVSYSIINNTYMKKVWNNPMITTLIIGHVLGDYPTIDDFQKVCMKLRTNPISLIESALCLIDDLNSVAFLKMFENGPLLENLIDKAQNMSDISRVIKKKLGLFHGNILKTWNIMLMIGPIKKYSPYQCEFLQFGLQKLGIPNIMLIIPTDEISDMIGFVIMMRNIIVIGVYLDSIIEKNELFDNSDLLKIYKERFCEVISFENIKFIKIILDSKFRNIRLNASIYLFMDFLSKPIPNHDIHLNLEQYYTLWAKKNEDDIDELITDLIQNENFISFKIFCNNNSLSLFTDDAINIFIDIYTDKITKSNTFIHTISRPWTQIYILNEDQFGSITSFMIKILSFSENTNTLGLYFATLEAKKAKIKPDSIKNKLETLLNELKIDTKIPLSQIILLQSSFTRERLSALQYLIYIYLEKTHDISWEMKNFEEYLISLLKCKLSYFMELVKAYHLGSDLANNIWKLP